MQVTNSFKSCSALWQLGGNFDEKWLFPRVAQRGCRVYEFVVGNQASIEDSQRQKTISILSYLLIPR
jgi:hypothetical protein